MIQFCSTNWNLYVLQFYLFRNYTNNIFGFFRPFLSFIIQANAVFVKRKCEQKGPKKVSTFSTRFHVVSNVFPKYQMLTF